jgi:hypothetical protein
VTNAKAQLGELAEALVGACDRSSHIARRKLTYETLLLGSPRLARAMLLVSTQMTTVLMRLTCDLAALRTSTGYCKLGSVPPSRFLNPREVPANVRQRCQRGL